MSDYYEDDIELIMQEEAAAYAAMDGTPVSEEIPSEPDELSIPKIPTLEQTGTDSKVIPMVNPVHQSETPQVVQNNVTPINQPQTSSKPSGKKPQKSKTPNPSNKDKSAMDYLCEVIDGCELFLDKDGNTFATIEIKGVKRELPVRSNKFQKIIHAKARRASGSTVMPTDFDIRTAVSSAEGVAYENDKVREVYARMNYNGERFVLDLCNDRGEIVYLDSNGWDIRQKDKEKFLQPLHMEELPRPLKNGSLRPFVELLNFKDPSNVITLIVWLISLFDTQSKHSMMCVFGPPGSGKSTYAKIAKRLFDPSDLDLFSVGRGAKDIAIQTNADDITVFDNEKNLSDTQANLLCRAITGGTGYDRQLYTDKEGVAITLKGRMIMTGIEIPFKQADLRDRALFIELDRLKPDERKLEREIMQRFEAIRAETLGACLDIFQKSLKLREQGKPINPKLKVPRMADSFHTGCFVAEAVGFGEEKYAEAVDRSIRKAYAWETESEPLAAVIASLLEENFNQFGITEDIKCAEDWHKSVINHASSMGIDPKELPKAPNSFTRRLRQQIVDLEHLGWGVSISNRTNPCRKITFKKLN